MSGLAITITDKGRAALVAASGTKAVTIAAVGISAAAVAPTTDATALAGEIKRLATFSGEVTDATTIHLTIRDDSTDSYALRAFALYLSDGTLFAIYGGSPQAASAAGQTDATIMEKTAGSMLMLAVDIAITGSDATAIAFGDTNFLNPAATTEVQGVVELATETETAAGTDAKRAVTPKGLLAAVGGWLDARFGAGAPSAFVKDLLAKVGAADILTALGIKSAAQHEAADFLPAASYTAADVLTKLTGVDGAGSGLDADTLDGKQASEFACLTGANFTGTVLAQRLAAGWDSGVDGCICSLNGFFSVGNTGWYNSTYNGGWYMTDTTWVRSYNDKNVYTAGMMRADSGFFVGDNNQYVVWHAGNDGAGSGLDADTLDGHHAADFMSAYGIPDNSLNYINARVIRNSNSAYANDGLYLGYQNSNHGVTRILGGGASAGGIEVSGPGYNDTTINGAVVWNSGNDGAGSGLDADTLDGLHADSFARVTASYNSVAGGYRVWSDGYKECWGTVAAAANAYTTVTYPVAFASWSLAVCTGGNMNSGQQDNGPFVSDTSITGCTIYSGIDSTETAIWHAWGY